jgi:hypothetical protein
MDHPLIASLERGFSVIPVSDNKRPLVAWRDYQEHVAGRAVVEGWVSRYRSPFGGVVTGRLSGVVVVDYDDTTTEPSDDTLVVRTPSGFHAYFQHPGAGHHVVSSAGWMPGVDVRGDGGMVIAPGSPGYEVLRGSWNRLAECPDALVRDGDWVSRRRAPNTRRRRSPSEFPAMRISSQGL